MSDAVQYAVVCGGLYAEPEIERIRPDMYAG